MRTIDSTRTGCNGRWTLLAAATLSAAAIGACSSGSELSADDGTLSEVAVARDEQGWDSATRDGMYHISQGSELMPMAWFLALEDASSTARFTERLGDFGFLASDAAAAANPRRLPVGFSGHTNDETAALYGERDWVGLTCSACHTGEIKVNGRAIRIEGGAGLVDLARFQDALLDAVRKTVADTSKFARFAATVRAGSAAPADPSLADRLASFALRFGERLARNPGFRADGKTIEWGPGRIDGLGTPTNETLCKLAELGSDFYRGLIEDYDNCTPGQPPASLPALWGVTYMEYVQWTGNVHSALGRNVGEVQGVYGTNWVEAGTLGIPRFRSSANVRASHTIEGWLATLEAPNWSALAAKGLLPALDPSRVQRGSAIYAAKCQSCHAVQPELTPPNDAGYRYWRVGVYTADEVGTDRALLEVSSSRTATLPLLLRIPFGQVFGSDLIGPGGEVPASAYRALMVGAAMQGNLGVAGIEGDEEELVSECRDDRRQEKEGYKARSLEGIVFTAPFLHNGSVPTLDDLLRPRAERPTSFYLGCRDYDASRVGYVCAGDRPGLLRFDTSLPANGNGGHDGPAFGTDLDAEGRADVIEYLKSLTQPAAPPVPVGGICAAP